MNIRKVMAVAVILLITAANLFAEDFSITEEAMAAAFSKAPLKMAYHERSGAWPVFQEKDIDFDIEGSEAIVTFSSDQDAEPKPDDPRPPLKRGDKEAFDFMSYIREAAAFSPQSAETGINFSKETVIDQITCRIYKIKFSYLSSDGRSWPMSGELWIDKLTNLPYKLFVKYDKAPDDLKSLSYELLFKGDSIEDCRVDQVFSVMKGVYIIFQYTLEQTRVFQY